MVAERLEVCPLSDLRLDPDLQMRAEGDPEYLDELASLFDEENPTWPRELPPASGCFDGSELWVWDGFQRLAAAAGAGCVNVPVLVRTGTRAEAAWLACSANKTHGLRRKHKDIHRAIQAAIALRPGLPARNYALHIGVHVSTVAEWIRRHGLQSGFPTLCKKNPPAMSGMSKLDIPDMAGGKCEPANPSPSREPGEDDGDFDEADEPAVVTQASGAVEQDVEVQQTPAASSSSAPAAAFGIDDAGLAIPTKKSADAFEVRGLLSTAEYLMSELAKVLDDIGKHDGGELIRANELKMRAETRDGKQAERLYSPDLENLKHALKHWRPYSATCPYCKGEPKPACKVCLGLPYVIRSAWDAVPEKLRDQLKG